MKRFHVHLAVADLDASVAFYRALFAAEPTVLKPDYAKWMLDDPRVNFAISTRGRQPGLDHLGIQVENDEELGELRDRLDAAALPAVAQEQAACCYARSTSTGRWTRKGSRGNRSTAWTRSRCSARTTCPSQR